MKSWAAWSPQSHEGLEAGLQCPLLCCLGMLELLVPKTQWNQVSRPVMVLYNWGKKCLSSCQVLFLKEDIKLDVTLPYRAELEYKEFPMFLVGAAQGGTPGSLNSGKVS